MIKRAARHCLTHWKTTLLGAVSAGCVVALPLVTSGGVSTSNWVVAFVLAAVGAASRDWVDDTEEDEIR